jgi:hypothetical protein
MHLEKKTASFAKINRYFATQTRMENKKSDFLSEANQRFSSRVLWHFTGYNKEPDSAYEVLTKILSDHLLDIGKKDEESIMHDGEKRLGHSVSCLCDIPFKDLGIHMARYGCFGVAFHKQQAIQCGHFNPILYIDRHSHSFEWAKNLLNEIEGYFQKETNHEFALKYQEFLYVLGSYIKPSDLHSAPATDLQKDKNQTNNFYYEREWRSMYKWNFSDDAIAAIMMPSDYIPRFREQFIGLFNKSSIISSEMVDIL